MRKFIQIIACLALLSFGAGFLGALHPIGDSLSVGRIPALLLAVVLAPFATPWRILNRGLFAALLAYTAFGASQFFPDDPKGGGFGVYQKNLSFRLKDPTPLVADIFASNAQVVMLQEVTNSNRKALEMLKADYPSQRFCRYSTVGGVAVLAKSARQLETLDCIDSDGFAAMKIEVEGQAVWVVSLHLHWPYPHAQAKQVDRLAAQLRQLDGPAIVGGDFNMMPWGHSVKLIERATGTRRVGHVMTTFELRENYPLFIDHVLAGGFDALYAQRRERLGSDHYGVLAWLKVP